MAERRTTVATEDTAERTTVATEDTAVTEDTVERSEDDGAGYGGE
jgi:hypothetical protein